MPDSIVHNASVILATLASQPPIDEMGRIELTGEKIRELTGLTPAQINDAVAILEDSGLVETFKALGTAPFMFAVLQITSRGKFEFQKSFQQPESSQTTEISQSTASVLQTERETSVVRTPTPVGSPFGFTDHDWELVSERKTKSDVLYVVMGYQFRSDHYITDTLVSNVKQMFQHAVTSYNSTPGAVPVSLHFSPLAAGYGEHLFNEISRDIIASDIAVFDTSDLNSNVMIELGVALTWGVRVLPIKKNTTSKPPSDISGQTWADYEDSGSRFIDDDHQNKLIRMVERAARKKIHR